MVRLGKGGTEGMARIIRCTAKGKRYTAKRERYTGGW